MSGSRPTVAIDGPGGSGKSTVARAVAESLGLEWLDTGAMYRAVTLLALRRGVATDDEAALAALAEAMVLDVRGRQVLLDGADVSEEIRSDAVNGAVSVVAAHPAVRRNLVGRQRAWVAARGGGVLEGRDIGSVVLPEADVKVYLTASVHERARRRSLEEEEGGGAVSVEATRSSIEARDHIDSSRADSPLQVVDGAHLIDSTGLSAEEVAKQIVSLVPGDLAPAAAAAVATAGEQLPAAGLIGFGLGERLLYAVCRFFSVGLSRILCPGRVVGRDHLPKRGPYLVAPVHRSNIDFLIVARISRRRLHFLAKAEIWKHPRIGRFIEHLGAVPVHRETTDRESFNRTLQVLQGGEPLVVFPEGTRREGALVGEIREGAAYLAMRAGVPIVPVGLAGTDRVMPKGKRLPRPARVQIVIGPPIPTATGDGRRVARSRVRAVTEELREAIQLATENAHSLLG